MESVRALKLVGIVLFSTLVMGCGKGSDELRAGPFLDYVSRFEKSAALEGRPLQVTDLVIQFGPMDAPSQRALCKMTAGKPPTILVEKTAWDRMEDRQREATLFHEMGHCVLKRQHLSTLTSDGIPASIMNPYELQPFIYSEYKDYYLQELFGGA